MGKSAPSRSDSSPWALSEPFGHRVCLRPVLVDSAPDVPEEQSLMGTDFSSTTYLPCKARIGMNFLVSQFCYLQTHS